jgi:anti-sigma regulatory factor (Ser/Thr protein kinase)
MDRTTDPPDNHITLAIPPNAASVDKVLTGVRTTCAAAGISSGDAETLVVELFNNVIKHAAGQGENPVTIDLDATDHALCGAVHDLDPRIPPVPAAITPGTEGAGDVGDWANFDDNGGWGLSLCASLCAGGQFEFVREQGGKAAQFCLPAAPADQATPGAGIPICDSCGHQAGCGCDCCPYPLPAAGGVTTANVPRAHGRTDVDLRSNPVIAVHSRALAAAESRDPLVAHLAGGLAPVAPATNRRERTHSQ